MPAGGMPNEPAYMNPASLYRGGEINGGFIGDSQSLSGSRKSLGPLQVSCFGNPDVGLALAVAERAFPEPQDGLILGCVNSAFREFTQPKVPCLKVSLSEYVGGHQFLLNSVHLGQEVDSHGRTE